MSASFKSLVLSFCGHGDALQSAALALQARARSMSYPDYRNEAARIVGEKYGVEPHESRKGGLLTFAKDSAPEQRLTRILALHPGKPTQKTEASRACDPSAHRVQGGRHHGANRGRHDQGRVQRVHAYAA